MKNRLKARNNRRYRREGILAGVLMLSLLCNGFGFASAAGTVSERIDTMAEMNRTEDSLLCAGTVWGSEPFDTGVYFAEEVLPVLEADDLADLELAPGGMPFGVKFLTEGVTVVGFCDVESNGKKINPGANAGLKLRDVILTCNGESLVGAADLTQKIEQSQGKELVFGCRRGKNELEIRLTPIWSEAEGRYQTGIWVRDSGAGIGTVTFIVPDTGTFAGLGHGICDGDTGELIAMKRGIVSDVTVSSVIKGLAGKPGELKGYFNPGKVGSLLGNSSCGVWGVFSEQPEQMRQTVPVGLRNELQEGDATILCTLENNQIGEYHVTVSNINRESQTSKCFTVTVTDENLLAITGGIVQGMSGSPILQNGKLVGAVTHVLINNPAVGYGIFLENMLTNVPMEKAMRTQ